MTSVLLGVPCESCGREGFDPLELHYDAELSRLVCDSCAGSHPPDDLYEPRREPQRFATARNVAPPQRIRRGWNTIVYGRRTGTRQLSRVA